MRLRVDAQAERQQAGLAGFGQRPADQIHAGSRTLRWLFVAGTGAIDTMSINHQPWAKDLPVPYVIARVRLDGVPGVYLTTNIVGSPVEDVHFDDKVRVVFEEQDGIFYPLFEKLGPGQIQGAA